METHSTFRLVPARRAGEDLPRGGRRSERDYLDFEVDGEQLGPLVTASVREVDLANDYASVVVTNWPGGFPSDDVRRLLGEVDSELSDGRIPLYVCAECGGLGCGAITAVIERTGDEVVWRDFGRQTDYDPFVELEAFENVGPFRFSRSSYEAELRRLLEEHGVS